MQKNAGLDNFFSRLIIRPSEKHPQRPGLSLSAIKSFPTGLQSPWMAGSEAERQLLMAMGSEPGVEFAEATFCRHLQ